MSRLKLHFALALSALTHALFLLWPERTAEAPRPEPAPVLQARLQTAPAASASRAPEPEAEEPLLKDTRSEQAAPTPRPPPVVQAPRGTTATAKAREQAQQKLNRHVFYPPEAVEQELEGEVTLRLLLDASGRVIDAAVLAGSGHAILDRAALDAARQIGRIDAGGAREILLPVVFRLD
ncbi:energy transducer TonB [Methyloversatilis sp.]|uniref:energy transducer TonB n=1 Tax=Methyloversatilis sp. TaxID=2569862 RepID=UPI002734785E|nr:energy transducer TonB [Methyloversatilis sp.]MDP2868171.1 TonB family protein [Methyloversatilis sp.]MDP3457391.1 TonB family protein [Methyloversatilis sp.]MDP3578689.1 TonB family protein [Methyloversatilis sp.]